MRRSMESGRRVGPARRGAALALAVLLVLSSGAEPVFAWSRVGHRTCGKLTEMLLTPKAKQEIRALLDEGESLADASTWADEHRDADRGSASWHYVNVPVFKAEVYDSSYCGKGGCVVSKIQEMRKILADETRPRAARQRALRYLVHFVQDIHQPLHVGDNGDKGGNDLQVELAGRPTNLHSVWDGGLLSRIDRNEDRHLARLRRKLTPQLEKEWSGGSVEKWATESLLLAKTAYSNPVTKTRIRSGDRLDDRYVEANAEALDVALSKAGVRLAGVLNDVFK